MRTDHHSNLPALLGRQGIAGFTLLTFLVSQLAWPLPLSAQDALRQQSPPENRSGAQSGAEELSDALKPAGGMGEDPVIARVKRILEGEDPLADFIDAAQSSRLAHIQIDLSSPPVSSKPLPPRFGTRRAQQIRQILLVSKARMDRYESGERSVDTLRQLERRIVYRGIGGSPGTHFPTVTRAQLKKFATRHWNVPGNDLSLASKARLARLLKKQLVKGLASRFSASPGPHRLEQAFRDLELTIRREGVAPKRVSAVAKKLATEPNRKTPPDVIQRLRKDWVDASRKAVDRLLQAAPEGANQPIGFGTSVEMEDQAKGFSIEHLAGGIGLSQPTLGLLKQRVSSGRVAIVVKKHPSDGSKILIRILNATINKPTAIQPRIDLLKQFPTPIQKRRLFKNAAGHEEPEPPDGLKQKLNRLVPILFRLLEDVKDGMGVDQALKNRQDELEGVPFSLESLHAILFAEPEADISALLPSEAVPNFRLRLFNIVVAAIGMEVNRGDRPSLEDTVFRAYTVMQMVHPPGGELDAVPIFMDDQMNREMRRIASLTLNALGLPAGGLEETNALKLMRRRLAMTQRDFQGELARRNYKGGRRVHLAVIIGWEKGSPPKEVLEIMSGIYAQRAPKRLARIRKLLDLTEGGFMQELFKLNFFTRERDLKRMVQDWEDSAVPVPERVMDLLLPLYKKRAPELVTETYTRFGLLQPEFGRLLGEFGYNHGKGVRGPAVSAWSSTSVVPEEVLELLPEIKRKLDSQRERSGTASPAGGLEEKRPARERAVDFLGRIRAQARQEVTPVLVGRVAQEQDSRLRGLAGLEEQGIYLDETDRPALFTRMIGREVRHFLFVGLEEEAQRLRPFTDRAGMSYEVFSLSQLDARRSFQELIAGILSRATGLEEAALQAQQGFREFIAGLEELSSGA